MNARTGQCILGAWLCLTGSLTFTAAQQPAPAPARDPGAPIIFSDPNPQQTSVSSNLTELRKPQAPFGSLDSNLKGPNLLRSSGANENAAALKRIVPTAPTLNRKSAKELENEQAEMMYLFPNGADGKTGNNTLFNPDDKPGNAKGSPRTSLEQQYYEQLDRSRGVMTNQAAANNPLGNLNETTADKFGALNPKLDKVPRSGNSASLEVGTKTSTALTPLDDARTSSSRLADTANAIRSPKSLFGEASDSSIPRRSASEARMDDFKRLLEGPRSSGATPNNALGAADSYRNFNSPSALYGGNAAARTPAPTVTVPTVVSTSTAKPDPQQEFVRSANLMGNPIKPEGLAELKSFSSLSEPPPRVAAPVQQPPVSTFKIPKRRF